MVTDWAWAAAFVTVGTVLMYEVALLRVQRRRAAQGALARHASLREAWFAAVSAHPGSELLAVQTLRNSLMSATVLASTAALALMGTVSLAAPSLHASLDLGAGAWAATPRLLLELVLLGLLFAALAASMMAVRLYNHASFIAGIPIGSPARQDWSAAGVRYVRTAGVLYGLGLRQLLLVVPIVAALMWPLAGPVAALLVGPLLWSLDRHHAGAP